MASIATYGKVLWPTKCLSYECLPHENLLAWKMSKSCIITYQGAKDHIIYPKWNMEEDPELQASRQLSTLDGNSGVTKGFSAQGQDFMAVPPF